MQRFSSHYCTATDTVYNPKYCEYIQELLKCAN